MPLFVGLMSGTSLDGIDAVVVDLPNGNEASLRILAATCVPMPEALRSRILHLCAPGENEIDLMGEADVALANAFAAAADAVIASAGVARTDVKAIGSHGQTIRHRPNVARPFTLQIGDPNIIAELTGITTVADFRRRDVAAGGQGAPLVPAFHAWLFRSGAVNRAVVNLGGIANITLLPADENHPVQGFDTGPANVLLDLWHARHRGTPVDTDGAWARSGRVSEPLLNQLLADKYFSIPPPKSTGRELFNANWLERALESHRSLLPHDVQATLTELTAVSVANALLQWGRTTEEVFLCGGGAHNLHLRERIAHHLPEKRVTTTGELGLEPDWVEAVAFAWLAHQTLRGRTGNLPEVTGAARRVVLGGIYPGGRGVN